MQKIKLQSIHIIFFFILLGVLSPDNFYGQSSPIRKDRPINVGFRIGFNALSTTGLDSYQDGTKLSYNSYTNESGYSINTLFRINLDRFFMQPEIGWNIYKQKFAFSLPLLTDENEDIWSSPYTISRKTQTANINILVGYDIIKNGPFVFSAFAGPSFKYNYYSKFEYNNNIFRDNTAHYNTYGILGFSFNITRLYVDIRYEISIMNTDINFTEISGTPEIFKDISIKKNENILSFACGVFF